jgi:hypothetical protein
VAHALAFGTELPSKDQDRLRRLGLIKISSDTVKLTAKGRQRYEQFSHSPSGD